MTVMSYYCCDVTDVLERRNSSAFVGLDGFGGERGGKTRSPHERLYSKIAQALEPPEMLSAR